MHLTAVFDSIATIILLRRFTSIVMKGIILAGGSGTRLYPVTEVISKQLLPVYDKPMIYYPLSTLMLAGIRDVLVISTPADINRFEKLLGDGSSYGIKISYAEQPEPKGLAEAFIIGKEFSAGDDVALVLGDNILYGHGMYDALRSARKNVSETGRASIFGYYVHDPERYGVVEFGDDGEVLSIQEKPPEPKSSYAVIGLYFYPGCVTEVAETIKPSDRGELEITSVNQHYLAQGRLDVELLGRGYAWFDAGTHDSLLQAASYVQMLESRQGLQVSCLEEIAYNMGYIDEVFLRSLALKYEKNRYGKYLLSIAGKTK